MGTPTAGSSLPAELPPLEALAETWSARWDSDETYRFDRTAPRDEVYAIDTPPPTVSGSLHVGHVFSFTHTDVIARFQRMRGRKVFYPIGWDDNGLPTEKRAQNVFNVRAGDPSAQPSGQPPGDGPRVVDRAEFIRLCEEITERDEEKFEQLFRRIGLSVDWSLKYTTISARSRAISQRAFLANLARGEAYLAQAPTLWDVTFGTAVAQAEIEHRAARSAYHSLDFGDGATVATTRPELLPACVAVLAHPSDDRYAHLAGTHLTTPVFGARVPMLTHHLVEPDRGTGLVMVCTFGDVTDVTWWRELDLPIRPVIGPDGRFLPDPPDGLSEAGESAYRTRIAGRFPGQARMALLELLGDTRPQLTEQQVAYYERGERPLEIISTWQWYIRNGGRDPQLRENLLERGRELTWQPPSMRARFEAWVDGLAGDWLISRQRYHGVPIPIWYPLGADGEPMRDRPLVPDDAALPIDPSRDTPPGYEPDQRGKPGGFTGESDVMDTWATSSLTSRLAAPDGTFEQIYPMDLRPQAHEIIRTWLFVTLLRSQLDNGRLPWSHTAISGWVVDPAKKKISKSAAVQRVVTPDELLDSYGADAVRYWAASGRPGTDTAFDIGQMKIGRRLATKILNASRFVLGLPEPEPGAEITEPVDLGLLARLDATIAEVTAALDDLDQGRALEAAERFFWYFCDDYVELVKARAYGGVAPGSEERARHSDTAADNGETDGADSARAALRAALDVQLRLLAPMLPFVTEEVWSWWREGSIHRAPWPSPSDASGDSAALDAAVAALAEIRKAKSIAKVSMKAEVSTLIVAGPEQLRDVLAPALADLQAAGRIAEVVFESAEGTARHEVILT